MSLKKILLAAASSLLFLFFGLASGQDRNNTINNLKKKSDGATFDKLVTEFMQTHGIRGVSIAFAKDGKILFASGYGYSDVERKEKVTLKSRFRIASVSKPITSAAILMLVERGKLSLTDKVFGKQGIFKGKYLKEPNPNAELIEVRHLLKHVAAPEWVNKAKDPMFQYPNLNHNQLITRILSERKLKKKPGEKYAYSNFGYCILGRVIEKVSGRKYEDFVRKEIFSKYKLGSFEIGGDTLAERREKEVKYYSNGGWAYKMRVGRMDSHGGWIANALDLVKFAQRVDGFSQPKDILKSGTIALMKTGSKANKRYGMGWAINFVKNSWHMGALPGTSAVLVNTSNGMTWCVLTNSRGMGDGYFNELDRLTWRIVKKIEL